MRMKQNMHTFLNGEEAMEPYVPHYHMDRGVYLPKTVISSVSLSLFFSTKKFAIS